MLPGAQRKPKQTHQAFPGVTNHRSRLLEIKSNMSTDTEDLARAISASPNLRRASSKIKRVQQSSNEEQEDRRSQKRVSTVSTIFDGQKKTILGAQKIIPPRVKKEQPNKISTKSSPQMAVQREENGQPMRMKFPEHVNSNSNMEPIGVRVANLRIQGRGPAIPSQAEEKG